MSKHFSKREILAMFNELNVVNIKEVKGWQRTTCPACSKGRHKSTEPCLRVNVENGGYICGHCGWTGNVTLKKEYKPMVTVIDTKRQTALPLTAKEYLIKERGLTEEVIARNGIMSETRMDIQSGTKKKFIVFNYKLGSFTVGAKYRTREKAFQTAKGGMSIFYKLNDVFESDTIIITEGEIDALTYEVAGFPYAISIPNGGIIPKHEREMEYKYIDECYPYIKDAKKILISTDNDIVGRFLQKEFIRRFGRQKCYKIKYPVGCKDANEVLLDPRYGVEKLQEMVRTASLFPSNELHNLSSREKEFMDLWAKGHQDGYHIEIPYFDNNLRWFEGNFYLVTGYPGMGKSTLVDMVIARLAIFNGIKTGIYSPENKDIEIHAERIAEQMVGKSLAPSIEGQMTKEQAEQAAEFIKKYIHYVLPDEIVPIDTILDAMVYAIQKEGVKVCVIDPWNTIEHRTAKFQNDSNYHAETLNKMKYFAREHNVIFILIAHPTKGETDKDGNKKIPHLKDISGSAHFENICDVGIIVHQNPNGSTTVFFEKVKHKFMGRRLSKCTMWFDNNSQRLYYDERERSINLLDIHTEYEQFEKDLGNEPIDKEEENDANPPF